MLLLKIFFLKKAGNFLVHFGAWLFRNQPHCSGGVSVQKDNMVGKDYPELL